MIMAVAVMMTMMMTLQGIIYLIKPPRAGPVPDHRSLAIDIRHEGLDGANTAVGYYNIAGIYTHVHDF
jgi:hypothetical protein